MDTVFHLAVEENRSEDVKIILETHPRLDVNARDNLGNTALMKAALLNSKETMEILLSHPRILVNLVNQAGQTALSKAVIAGATHSVQTLLDKGAFINFTGDRRDCDEPTHVLFLAIQNEDADMTQFLLTNGADVNICSPTGLTLLDWVFSAVKRQPLRLFVEILVDFNIDVNKHGPNEPTVLWRACEIEDEQIVDLVVHARGFNWDTHASTMAHIHTDKPDWSSKILSKVMGHHTGEDVMERQAAYTKQMASTHYYCQSLRSVTGGKHIVGLVANALIQMDPISEDLLFIAWELDSSTIRHNLVTVCKEGFHFNQTVFWVWFHEYLMGSLIWLHSDPEETDRVMFDTLRQAADAKKHKYQARARSKLRQFCANEAENAAWNRLLRSDLTEFEMGMYDDSTKIQDFESAARDLPNEITIAQSLNDAFQQCVEDVFQDIIPPQDILEQAVKTLSECQDEYETAREDSLQTSASMYDMIACRVRFETPMDLLLGLQHFHDSLLTESNSLAIQGVVGVDNGFARQEFSIDRPSYTDVKVNVVVRDDSAQNGVKWGAPMAHAQIQFALSSLLNLEKRTANLSAVTALQPVMTRSVQFINMTDLQTSYLAAVRDDDVQRMLRCICYGVDVAYLDPENGLSALNVAARYESTHCMEVLLSNTQFIAKERDTIGHLLNLGDETGATPLMNACAHGNLEGIQQIVRTSRWRAQVDLNARSKLGNTAVMLATTTGNSNCLRAMINAGADVNITNDMQYPPLMVAMKRGERDCFAVLISNGADVNQCDQNGESALMFAVGNNSVDYTRILAAHPDTDIDWKEDVHGDTSLIVASKHGFSTCVEILMENGADVRVTNKAGMTAFRCAELWGHADIVELLIK